MSTTTSPADACEGAGNRLFDTTDLCRVGRLLAQRPYHELLQPLDVALFGLVHVLVGMLCGWVIDTHLFGPPAARDGPGGDAARLSRILGQIIVVVLTFNYVRKALVLVQPRYGTLAYVHRPVPTMDSGFAMGMGFAWTQRNLVRAFHDLLDRRG